MNAKSEKATSTILLIIITLALFWLLRLAGELANGWNMVPKKDGS